MSKEEIEKVKKYIKNSYVMSTKHCLDDENKQLKQVIETLLQYIKEIEADNYELNNRLNEYIEDNKKQNKIIDELLNFLAEPDLGHYKSKIGGEILGKYTKFNKEDWKKHFEKKVDAENQQLKQKILGILKGEN